MLYGQQPGKGGETQKGTLLSFVYKTSVLFRYWSLVTFGCELWSIQLQRFWSLCGYIVYGFAMHSGSDTRSSRWRRCDVFCSL